MGTKIVVGYVKKEPLYSIQALRAIAAALVVVLHAFVHLEARNLIPSVPEIVEAGRVGVDIFFVISGFIMVYISGENFKKQGASRDFIVKRLIRVAPTYWLYTLLMAVLLLSYPQSFSHGKSFSPNHLLASLAFVPWPNSLGDIKPILNVGWTLNYEIYFYLIFAILLLFSKKLLLPLLSVILLSGIAAGLLFEPVSPIYSVVTSSLPIEFLMGCLIAVGYKRQLQLSTSLCFVLIISGAAVLLLSGILEYETASTPRAIKWGGGSAMLVAGAVFLERNNKLRIPLLFTSLGNSSYSLISHSPIHHQCSWQDLDYSIWEHVCVVHSCCDTIGDDCRAHRVSYC